MIPGSLYAAHDASLAPPRSTKSERTDRSVNGMSALFDAPQRALRVLSVWRRRAASRRALAELDDYLLHDIGLTRADAEQELTKPFWQE
jgi:uncharacterized protein YjiS (DUF1127 family)